MARISSAILFLGPALCSASLSSVLEDLKGQSEVDCEPICQAAGGSYRGHSYSLSGQVTDYRCKCGSAGTLTIQCVGDPYQECCKDQCQSEVAVADTPQGWQCPAKDGCAGGDNGDCDGDREWKKWVAAHNIYRCMHDIPAVSWNHALFKDTKRHFRDATEMEHSQSYDLPSPAGPAGENLYWSSANCPVFDAVASWYSEIKDCGSFPGCKAAGGKAVGHFTAMIWQGAKEIGCYMNDNNLAACRYKGLNYLSEATPNFGKRSAYNHNVFKPVKSFEDCKSKVAACGFSTPDTSGVDAATGYSLIGSVHSEKTSNVFRSAAVASMAVVGGIAAFLGVGAVRRSSLRTKDMPEGEPLAEEAIEE